MSSRVQRYDIDPVSGIRIPEGWRLYRNKRGDPIELVVMDGNPAAALTPEERLLAKLRLRLEVDR